MMLTHILIPVDGSELSMAAARYAVALAGLIPHARVTALMVSPPYKRWVEEGFVVLPKSSTTQQRYKVEMRTRAAKVLDKVKNMGTAACVKCKALHLFADAPFEAIIKVATRASCDLIVMGSRGNGAVKQLLVGSETTRVLSHTRIPVLVYR